MDGALCSVTDSRIGALTWLQNRAKSCSTGSKKRKRAGYGCAVPAATDAMGALDGPLANLLLIGPAQLPLFVNGGDLANAVQAIFASGRAIAALITIPGECNCPDKAPGRIISLTE